MTPQQLAAACLADPRRNGVYRVAADGQRDLQDPALCWKTLAPRQQIDRTALLAALGETLAFPDYYGQNWDAAWDCLTELDWPAGQLLVLHLPIAADAPVVETDLATFLELLLDACEHWAAQGRALCLLIETVHQDLTCLDGVPRLERLARTAPE